MNWGEQREEVGAFVKPEVAAGPEVNWGEQGEEVEGSVGPEVAPGPVWSIGWLGGIVWAVLSKRRGRGSSKNW